MNDAALAQAFRTAGQFQQAGKVAEATAIYQNILAAHPNQPDALHLLGFAALQSGNPDQAVELISRAIAIQPGVALYHCNLGYALLGIGRLDGAIAEWREAIRLDPLMVMAHNNLGNALTEQGHFDEAIAAYRQTLRLKPDIPETLSNLANALANLGQLDEAVATYQQAVRLKPEFADGHNDLGSTLQSMGRLDEAFACFAEAIRLQPNHFPAYNNLGGALPSAGRLDEAIAAYRQAMRIKPDDVAAHSNFVFTIQFHPAYDAKTILAEARRWNDRHAEALGKSVPPHTGTRDPDRRLRIGYVAADFRDHCQSFFTIPLLSNRNRQGFEVFCYADVRRPDAVTRRIRGFTDAWRLIVGKTDAEVAQMIREDGIDILVDLAMHMAGGRPLVFARKPAPIQVAWLAYPGTTGLSAMDYRLTDPHLDPPGSSDASYCETSIRLPETFWCYDPLATEPDVNPLPAETTGYVTFGCLNNFLKVNEGVLQLWARVLSRVERSRMMILSPEGSHRRPLLEQFNRGGVDPGRIEFIAHLPRAEYLKLYHRMDLGLDTFPYNGHTTSLDSLWMGVPVITLAGQTIVGRAGVSQLTNLNLRELIATTPQQYIEIAANLANDLPRLSEIRRTLRSRMQASPLMDGPRFARGMEAAYRRMWRNWCAKGADSR